TAEGVIASSSVDAAQVSTSPRRVYLRNRNLNPPFFVLFYFEGGLTVHGFSINRNGNACELSIVLRGELNRPTFRTGVAVLFTGESYYGNVTWSLNNYGIGHLSSPFLVEALLWLMSDQVKLTTVVLNIRPREVVLINFRSPPLLKS